MNSATTTKPVSQLAVGDIVLGIATTVFTEPKTVVSADQYSVKASGGCFWPIPQLGHRIATIAA
jgi:hypothetical protein